MSHRSWWLLIRPDLLHLQQVLHCSWPFLDQLWGAHVHPSAWSNFACTRRTFSTPRLLVAQPLSPCIGVPSPWIPVLQAQSFSFWSGLHSHLTLTSALWPGPLSNLLALSSAVTGLATTCLTTRGSVSAKCSSHSPTARFRLWKSPSFCVLSRTPLTLPENRWAKVQDYLASQSR